MVKRLLDDVPVTGIGNRFQCFLGVTVGGRVSRCFPQHVPHGRGPRG